jgi:centromere protein C
MNPVPIEYCILKFLLDVIQFAEVVSYAASLKDTNLPLPTTGRRKHEGKIVGRAAQSFNVPSSDNNVFVGYLMGNLKLPPKGIKDPESTGACSQVFTVCSCQPNSLEVAFGDPHEEEGSLSPLTAQRFLLSSGDQFRIPPGNAYRLENHSSTTECMMAWTIIRPPKSELMS